MGKGDQKTRRGKLFKGTYGIRRKRKKSEVYKPVEKIPEQVKDIKPETPAEKTVKKAAPAKKAARPKKAAESKGSDKKDK